MPETKTIVIAVSGALTGLSFGFLLGRRRPTPERRLDQWTSSDLLATRAAAEVEAIRAQREGHVYWILTGDDTRPVTVVVDESASINLHRGLDAFQLVNDPEDLRITGNVFRDLEYNFTRHYTVFDVPFLGNLRLGHHSDYSRGALPEAVGSLSIIRMDEDTRANQVRLNEYLVDLLRLRALGIGGAFKGWPAKAANGQWPKRDGPYWVDAGGIWDDESVQRGLDRARRGDNAS